MITKEKILEAAKIVLVEDEKIEITVGKEFWTGKGLSDEAPDAKTFKNEKAAMKEVKNIKKKYPKKVISLTFDAGQNSEHSEEV